MDNSPTFRPYRRKPRAHSADDGSTRTLLLEAARSVFAEYGFDRATGRAICDRASVNPAAINYHFGGMEDLYLAVLIEAHRHLVTEDSLSALASSRMAAPEKLRSVIELFVRAAMGTTASSWAFRILGREIVMPTPMFETLRVREVMPKIGHVRQIVAELMSLPESHPAVTRGIVTTVAPCVMMLIADRGVFSHLFPNVAARPTDVDFMVGHLHRFVLAGLAASQEEAETTRKPQGSERRGPERLGPSEQR